MDRLEAMSILLTVVETGSLSAAGRKLNVPLATVSRKVSELEAHLGTRLFNRSSRQFTPTDAGLAYIAACRRILDDVEEAERVASGEFRTPKGDLIISAPIVFGRLHLLPVVVEFLRAYPEIDIKVIFADSMVDLFEEHIDLALRIGALPDSGLFATRLGSIRHIVCASPAYLAEQGVPRDLAELERHACVAFQTLSVAGLWKFKSTTITPRPRLVVNTAEAAIDAAIAGVGVTRVLSYQAEAAIRTGALTVVLEDCEPAPLPVNLVHSGERLLPLKLRAFLDFATPRLKARVVKAALQPAPDGDNAP
ncbi:LysR family transcriptional regulator [Rhodoblastus acidophilus]|uniref:LysR family transcriptional regulator n=1 Tax=Rhodoblastus acidophilus TaxID=1074 RepID=A0A6N8DS99_RHOAC|nr:LysR family transcriptional regulator [Rhodoblastus acidophilus]MCW2273735.1 DNA-binding transcriptional LysR family regulator [Rhodoblastus acidophilus]MTV32706.1 LysR family transcriptional regulator [Rhodoblastus acidophilus]